MQLVSEPQVAKRFYRPELDVVRFIAFLFVFVHHNQPEGQGIVEIVQFNGLAKVWYNCQIASGFGLSLFFTLSAYLICELLLRERDATGVVQAKQFYVRRILRIWPLYFAGLGIGLAIAALRGGNHIAFVWTAWASVLLGNWYVFFHGYPGNSMFHLWSISVEEQFYLFAPWVIKYLNRTFIKVFCFALIGFANLWLFFLGNTHAPEGAIWCNSFVQFENFAAGMLLCVLLRGRIPVFKVWLRLAMLVACLCCWYYACERFHVHTEYPTPDGWSLIFGYGLVPIGCCLLLGAFLGLDRRFLPGWAVYLGRISYGLYVFHMTALHLAERIWLRPAMLGSTVALFRAPAALALTILFAAISYRYFETPFLKMKKQHEVIASRPV